MRPIVTRCSDILIVTQRAAAPGMAAAVGGSAVGGSAVGGSAVGGAAVGGAAVGGQRPPGTVAATRLQAAAGGPEPGRNCGQEHWPRAAAEEEDGGAGWQPNGWVPGGNRLA